MNRLARRLAACRRETDNSHAAQRLYDEEIADYTKTRTAERGGPSVRASRESRAEFRARVVPGRGARRRAAKRDGAPAPRHVVHIEGDS